jgi:multidrug efflux pump subunit AcrB
LAEAVIFAMIASYILSRTLVPTLAMYWMKAHGAASGHGRGGARFSIFGWFSGFHRWFNHQFEKFREGYRDLLSLGLRNPGKLVTLVLGFAAVPLSCIHFSAKISFRRLIPDSSTCTSG